MRNSSLKSFLWIIRLQFKEARVYSFWILFKSIYDGLSGILTIYIGAQFIGSVTAIALRAESASSSRAYLWLSLLFAENIVRIAVRSTDRVIGRRHIFKMELIMNGLLMEKMYELSQEQFDDQNFNTQLGRARDALNSVWNVTYTIADTISSTVSLITSLGTIMLVSPPIGAAILLLVVPASALRIRQNKLYEEVNKRVEPLDRIAYRSRWILIDPNHMPEVRLMNGFKHLLKSWNTNIKKSQKVTLDSDTKLLPLETAVDIIEPTTEFVATIYFLQRLIAGSFGLERFIFLRGLLSQASSSSSSIVSTVRNLHETALNMNYFIDIFNTAPAIPNGTIKVNSPLTIEFKNVDFSYPSTDKLILKDISFIIAPGSKLALVGENGAGKSTLLKLLLRQYLPKSGTIQINGVDIKDVEQSSYYRAISNLSQDFLIINHLTIKENLELGLHDDATMESIKEAVSLVGADSFIEKLPHAYEQRLDPSFDDGTGLSGGQRQRLGVARALLRNGDMLILDEPTSAIDAKAEYMIFNNIYKQHANKTTLIVSHRFSTVRKADKIIVMQQGQITEYGSHEELLKYGGLYKEMFEAQAEGYK